MNDLNEVLVQISEKIKKHRDYYKNNEEAVRVQLVNPILRSLGWNPEDPDDVKLNERTEDDIPDYTLIKNGNKKLFVEAKKLDGIGQKEIKQLGRYVYDQGVNFGVITDGAKWMLFKAYEEGKLFNDRTLWQVNLEKDELPLVYRRVKTISKNNIDHIESLSNNFVKLDEIWQSLLNEPEVMIKCLIPVVKSRINQDCPNYHFEDDEIEDLLKEKIKKIISGPPEEETPHYIPDKSPPMRDGIPRKMILKGEIFKLRKYNDILVNTATWLIKIGKLESSDCPVTIGRSKLYLINREPTHKDGASFRGKKQLSNGLWIHTNFSGDNCIEMAKELLKYFEFSPDVLLLKYE